MSSDTSVDSDSGRNSSSGRGRALEQPQGVTVSNNDSSEAEDIIASLRHNEGDGIIREDSAIQNRDKEIITGELKTPKEIEIAGEVSNEELSLAQEFGVANLLGSGRSMTNNPNACDNLSENPKLNKSRAAKEIRVHKSPNSHASPTWTRKEKKSQGITWQQVFSHKGGREWLGQRQITLKFQ